MSFYVLGRVVVILSSTRATKSLLERRGHTYSDRPVIPFFEMCTFKSSGPSRSFADTPQDGYTMGFAIHRVWAGFPTCAQDRREVLSASVSGAVPGHPRTEDSCPRRAHVGKPAGVGGTHRAVSVFLIVESAFCPSTTFQFPRRTTSFHDIRLRHQRARR